MKGKQTVSRGLLVAFAAMFAVGMLALAGCSCSSEQQQQEQSSSSAAEQLFTVPNVVSLKQADADKALAASGFSIGEVTQQASDSVPAGSVISQDPEGFTQAKAGSKVNLTISSGKAEPKDVQVPDLKGKSQSDAEKALSDAGLVGVPSNPEETDEVAAGLVFKQSIDAGSTVKEGTQVAFTVALAPAMVQVPDVVGKTRDEASATISDAQLGFDSTTAYNDDVEEGRVISQSIGAGTSVKAGTTVSVQVSLGSKPADDVAVPDVTTFSWSDAENALTSAGLQARYTGDPAGKVVSQDVAPGTMVEQGTLVTVTLASPAETVTVPDLVGESVMSAEDLTDSLGLALDITGDENHGTVVDQWPAAGTQVETRSTVHITVDDSDFREDVIPQGGDDDDDADDQDNDGQGDDDADDQGDDQGDDDADDQGDDQGDDNGDDQGDADDDDDADDDAGDGQNPVMNVVGPYSADRASIMVEPDGDDGAHVTVQWGSSASESTTWEMSGTFDADTKTITYSNGTKTDYVYAENGDIDSEDTVYTNGKGKFTFKDNGKLTLTWTDDKEHVADGMTFTFSS